MSGDRDNPFAGIDRAEALSHRIRIIECGQFARERRRRCELVVRWPGSQRDLHWATNAIAQLLAASAIDCMRRHAGENIWSPLIVGET